MSETYLETEELSVREVVEQTIAEEMERDERVFLQGIDVAGRGGEADLGQGLVDQFGKNRVRNTPISEVSIVGTGLGAAATGMRPIVEVMYSGFLGVPGDQILNQVAKMRYMFGGELPLPLTVRTHNTMGQRAGAQHSQSLHNWMSAIPGLTVLNVSTPRDTKGLLKSAIRSDDPVIVFEHSGIYNKKGAVPVDSDFTLPIGEAAVEREGDDVTVVATQVQLWNAFDAADILSEDGISVEIISPRTFSHLDIETIAQSVKKTGRCVIVDETPLRMGIQGDIASDLTEEVFFELDFPVQRIGVDNVPIPFSPPLEDDVVPSAEDIVNRVKLLS